MILFETTGKVKSQNTRKGCRCRSAIKREEINQNELKDPGFVPSPGPFSHTVFLFLKEIRIIFRVTLNTTNNSECYFFETTGKAKSQNTRKGSRCRSAIKREKINQNELKDSGLAPQPRPIQSHCCLFLKENKIIFRVTLNTTNNSE